MQIAGKQVKQVENNASTMDEASLRYAMTTISEALIEHHRVADEITDPLNRYEFDQTFAYDVARAQRAYDAAELFLKNLTSS